MGDHSARRLSLKWLVLWSVWAARLVLQRTPPVPTGSGLVSGFVALDGSYVQYMAIPYATVPRRFQAPGPVPPWDGVFDAINENIRCQQSVNDMVMIGRRDCLALNVYTPMNTEPDAKLPVMVFVHGGGYFQGSGSKALYGPEYLVKKNVILVTFNYRLNIQGFLCLRIKEAPGNAAMKDMVAALRWVQDNIRAFGGDPDMVTVFGESAGGASVSHLVLSPQTRGLFHRAVTQSGSALAPWAYQYRPMYLAGLLAKTMLHHTEDPHELFKLFDSKSDEELILTRVPRQEGNIIPSEILFTPCSEVELEGEEPFLTESPIDILEKGTFNKIPMIMGANTEEGLFLAAMDNDTMYPRVKFHKSLGKSLEFPSEEVAMEVGENMRRYYMGEDEDMSDLVKLSRLYGEPQLYYQTMEEIEWIVKSSDQPVFSYIFNYSGRRNAAKMFLRKPFCIAQNATHADELFYLFSPPWLPRLFEDAFIDKMTTLWTNFAKYGNPTPEGLSSERWSPVTAEVPTALLLDDPLGSRPLLYSPALRYLRHIYSKYRRR